MIVQSFLTILFNCIVTIFNVLPDIPGVPDSILNGINSFLNIIFDNLNLLNIFIPISTLKVVIPIVVFILNFEYIYKLTLWILKKLPLLGIE